MAVKNISKEQTQNKTEKRSAKRSKDESPTGDFEKNKASKSVKEAAEQNSVSVKNRLPKKNGKNSSEDDKGSVKAVKEQPDNALVPEEKTAEMKNLHEGHRQRVKNRFLTHGLDSFTDIQFLETLLFYAVPKKDTNETAHLLLNRFGSIRKVFAASYEELVKVKGVGENAASLIKFFQMGSKRYMELSFQDEDMKYVNSPEKLMEYCMALFLGFKKEAVYVIGLDADLAIVNTELICKGESDRAWISYKKLTEFAFKNNCIRLAIAHNHPEGIELASRQDLCATEEVAEFLDQIEIELVDHIIVGKGGAISMRKNHSELSFWKHNYSFCC